MTKNPEVTICGGQVRMFNDNKQILQISNHKSITWENYKKNPNHWNITCQCGKCQTVLVIEKKF